MPTNTLPLEDIILPPAISWWPLAWGWWAVIIASLVVLILLTYGLWRWLRKHRQQQQALQELAASTEGLQGSELYGAVNAWLKIQLKAQQPQALHWHGKAWAEFLQHSTAKPIFSDELLQALSQGLYQAQPTDISREQCLTAAEQWLRTKKHFAQGGSNA